MCAWSLLSLCSDETSAKAKITRSLPVSRYLGIAAIWLQLLILQAPALMDAILDGRGSYYSGADGGKIAKRVSVWLRDRGIEGSGLMEVRIITFHL